MKHQLLILVCSLALNCFAEEILPPAPSEPDGNIGGHEYVNLGLPSGTLWATYNVGATSPSEKGNYFAWGEIEPREDFSWENYKFFIEFQVDPVTGEELAILKDIGEDICGTEYDAARHQWGNGWRLPNEKERYELRMLCWWRKTTENGCDGVRIYGPNGHNIFLPVCGAGLWYGEVDPFNSTDGAYWTGMENPEYSLAGLPIKPSDTAKSLLVDSSGFTSSSSRKAYGLNIRAVVNPRESGIENIFSDKGKISLTYRDGNIHVKDSSSKGNIIVYDLSGRLICSGDVLDGICQLPEISKGIYLVSFFKDGDTVSTQKITVK